MTYRDLLYKATRLCDKGEITLGEYEEMTKPLDREVEQEPILDKIKAEIETKYGQCDICEYFENYDYEENDISEYRPIGNIADILQIIDKYKSEVDNGKVD
jgi:hypothetical protein